VGKGLVRIATNLLTRANLRAEADGLDECSDGWPGEILVGTDGRYLGDFANSYTVPFSYIYPTGWTNGTWYEQPATVRMDCSCTDCHGNHVGAYWCQRNPDDPIAPDDAGPYDFWDHSVNPSQYTGQCGCTYKLDADRRCAAGGHGYDGLCVADPDVGNSLDALAGWPMVSFGICNPSSRISIAAPSSDTSGPTDCLTEKPALRIDFSGTGAEGVTFMGEGGGHAGVSPPNGYNQGDRSTTGWTIDDLSYWAVRFWAKAIPDMDTGFVCSGYSLITRQGFYPFPFFRHTIDGDHSMTLTDDWQEYFWCWQAEWTLPKPSYPDPMLNAPLTIFTLSSGNIIPDQVRPIYGRKGSILIKQVHVYPCGPDAVDVHMQRYEDGHA
jgi:hypothetical protein